MLMFEFRIVFKRLYFHADLATFIEETFNGELHFLCSESISWLIVNSNNFFSQISLLYLIQIYVDPHSTMRAACVLYE